MQVSKSCPQCNKEVIQYYPSYPRIYCSRQCQWKAKVKNKPRCLTCNKIVKRQSLKYCSSTCYGKEKQGKERPGLYKRFIKKCARCNNDFEVGGRLAHPWKKYCSLDCQYRSRRKSMEEHSNLIDSANWKEMRLLIAKRQKYTCQLCLKILDITKIEINHIIPRSVKIDNTDENLIVMCNRCHYALDRLVLLGYDKNKQFDARKFFILLKEQIYST